MGSIDKEDVSKLNGICIKCGACIKQCPANAKYYDDPDYLRHKHELEIELTDRKEPDLFIERNLYPYLILICPPLIGGQIYLG